MHVTRNLPSNCVRAQIRRQGETHTQYFTLAKYGEWEKAEAAARRWVKKRLAELPPPTSSKDRLTKRNTSGVVGVRLADATRRKNGKEYPDWRWVAFWDNCPQAGGIGWSVKKYGDRRAFVMACLARHFETVDRERLDAEYEALKGSVALRTLLKRKRLSAPEL